jgi:uncharacterized protein (TIGR03437 family)
VVFLNGYQNDCGNSSFASNFGIADQLLQADGRVSLFWNNCDIPNRPSIETLGAAFGKYLAGLRYDDGSPLDTVDLVAYSMGGLIVRSYMSGKQEAPRTFQPPAAVPVRKLVFLATPQFGTGILQGFGVNRQVDELTSGSRFLFDLGTWNQDTDDFRGVDALAIIGNGGTGAATTAGFDDGVVATSSASIGFVQPGRTRIVPNCHTDGGGLISLVGLCPSNARGVAVIRSADDPQARALRSFLNGTDDWKMAGTAAEDDPILSKNGGMIVNARTADDADTPIAAADADGAKLTPPPAALQNAYNDMIAAGQHTVNVVTGPAKITGAVSVPSTVYKTAVMKPGPRVVRVFPAAAAVYPLSVAPGSLISIYGDQLAGGQVSIGSAAAQILYSAAQQINTVVPDDASGLVSLKVQTTSGSHTLSLFVQPAVPVIFTLNGSGSGAAAAYRTGDYLILFLTGLGATTQRGGLDWANIVPTVTVAGQNCAVSYAGRAPGYKGLDQINCLLPSGVSGPAAPVVVTSNNRLSNTATFAIQ